VKLKFISFYFDVAERVSQLSHAERLKVGAVIVKDHRILSYGYNGMPAGFPNTCEQTEVTYDERDTYGSEQLWNFSKSTRKYTRLVTKPEVIHAEMNAISKIAYHGDSCKGAAMFLTHSPCVECSKMILQCGITDVWYLNDYRSNAGIKLLERGKVLVMKGREHEENPFLRSSTELPRDYELSR
jgi:dCMP deaminase